VGQDLVLYKIIPAYYKKEKLTNWRHLNYIYAKQP